MSARTVQTCCACAISLEPNTVHRTTETLEELMEQSNQFVNRVCVILICICWVGLVAKHPITELHSDFISLLTKLYVWAVTNCTVSGSV